MNIIREDILKALTYFDIFHYPITKEEIRTFLNHAVQQPEFEEILAGLTGDKIIFKLDDFYSLQNDPALAERRRKGNLLAVKEMKHAIKAAKILSKFPYIKGLAISGSLSKNYADENTDVDFFIITEANRLWIARTLLHLFYKLAWLVGKHKWFCMNYYIDERGLEIVEKNVFTAMEIVTLIPMYGAATLQNFINANKWTKNYFPANSPDMNIAPEIKKGIFRYLPEKILNTPIGDVTDKWLMKLTRKRWEKKVLQHKVNEKGIWIGMLVGRHFSKPDPKDFQYKVVEQYNNKIAQLLPAQNKLTIPLN